MSETSKSVTLKHPVQFGSETINELVFKPFAIHFKGLSVEMNGDGGIKYAPYELAVVGVKMAGHPPSVADKLHPSDMNAVAVEVIGFFGDGLGTGAKP